MGVKVKDKTREAKEKEALNMKRIVEIRKLEQILK